MEPVPNQPSARIVSDPYQVDRRLRTLGLSRGPFIEAARQGDLQRRLCTPDDFFGVPGFVGWARTLRVLRENARGSHGWHNGSFLRIPVTYNNMETVAVAVSAGDERTGLPGSDPTTNEKGPSTVSAVEGNIPRQETLDLEEPGVDLYYFLTYAEADGELRCEVSSPRFIDDKCQISGWHERVILGRIDPDAGVRVTESPGPSEIHIDVIRKSS